jgi:NADH pyrophosphatase NudC (nudix superfamily)
MSSVHQGVQGVLGRQGFAMDDLIREPTDAMINGNFDAFTDIILVCNRKIEVRKVCEGEYVLAWRHTNTLKSFRLGTDSRNQRCVFYRPFYDTPSTPEIELPIYYLGYTTSSYGSDNYTRAFFACDVSAIPAPTLGNAGDDNYYLDMRTELPLLRWDNLARAGRALALVQWHQNHQFCAKCGNATASIQDGAKRQCLVNPLHKHYPRTDPVVITLVVLETPVDTTISNKRLTRSSTQSLVKEKVLLGRSKNLPAGTLTCLSGFIDQGESIEEAVAREVKEESGVVVHSVEILGSQPWPIGRAGSCELMIGCIAKTRSEELKVDYSEMAECRWVDKEEVLAALKNSLSLESPFISRTVAGVSTDESIHFSTTGRGPSRESSTPSPGFYVPPPFAIAHHLLRYWATNKGEEVQEPPASRSNKL